jgi:glycogenin
MSSDPTPFKAPERYPEPPRDMYYEVPKTPTFQKPAPIFPWEKYASRPTRAFPEDFELVRPTSSESAVTMGETIEPITPDTPVAHPVPMDPWKYFTSRVNTWDEIPEIEQYIRALQRNRRGNTQVLHGYGAVVATTSSSGERRPSLRLTDFPSELDRPSLPVTPAPVRRPSFWGGKRNENGELPAAEGVPAQADWVSLQI